MTTRPPFVLATRGSPLALWQARAVALRWGPFVNGRSIETRIVRTAGDQNERDALGAIGGTGLFTKEVDQEVLAGRAHAAVHSLKDLETELEDGLALVMTLPRGPVEDAWLTKCGSRLRDVPAGARVGTGSLRRRAQVLRERPDVTVLGIRGNVDSRLRQLDEGRYDALVLARAGLERLGLAERITEVLDVERFVPAPSQGLVGVTVLASDRETRALAANANCQESYRAGTAERAFLRRLGGGCNVPVGALARCEGDLLTLSARVVSLDGHHCVEGQETGPLDRAEELGRSLASRLLGEGASELIRRMELPGFLGSP